MVKQINYSKDEAKIVIVRTLNAHYGMTPLECVVGQLESSSPPSPTKTR
jgi:hypothetical protein